MELVLSTLSEAGATKKGFSRVNSIFFIPS